MIAAPTRTTDSDLASLKADQFTQPIAAGTLSSGQKYEIIFSAKSAVTDGFHFIVSFPGRTELSQDEQVESFQVANMFASEIPEAVEFGYRFAQNFGPMRNRPEPHAHLIVPGSYDEQQSAPRFVDKWRKQE